MYPVKTTSFESDPGVRGFGSAAHQSSIFRFPRALANQPYSTNPKNSKGRNGFNLGSSFSPFTALT